ncbi:peptide-methionine (S)-S-oxide reductase MsrA [Pelagerythrobacter marinus]|uniref:peptide-methionine (S)-S-oxide reductase MsrA n=1 Tax=Pelagerythrobacter marinus TaxID=538382 RepID=UPI002036D72E|nr:peptide-methionine (S)-S-oxide reductase MsrA [Pelagerythrobacter marinus]USA39235.1 peptide-methionine (S)-S-oxide reductase MsrA [Pelagerythrobacter marinus]WPZ06678.1 peptide-methionine (S)-S-oxide reductase MsrA [Pelagerythrobacter marinus]
MRALPALAGALAIVACQPAPDPGETIVAAPAAERVARETGPLKTAIFAGGCFWGVEGVFSHVRGVKSAVSGYHGGTERQARYELVASGVTDHAEAVRVTYDPALVRYDELVRIFFSVVADPTQRNRQGPDVGAHYRTALIPTSAEQLEVARAYLAQMERSGLWQRPIVAGIERAQAFFPAESRHQDFVARNPGHSYVERWDAPKVAALARLYPAHYSAAFQRG